MTKIESDRLEELEKKLAERGESSFTDGEKKELRHLQGKKRTEFLQEQQKRLAEEIRTNVGQWARSDWTPDDLAVELFNMVDASADEVAEVKVALKGELDTRDGHRLAKQLTWLDAHGARMGEIFTNAKMLLSIAHDLYLLPAGTRRQAMIAVDDDDGEQRFTPYLDPKIQPKWKDGEPMPDPVFTYDKLTDLDRQARLGKDLTPYQRWHDELENLINRISNRHFLGQKIMDRLNMLASRGL